jgi:predicted ATP-dependent serine protease
MFVCLQCGAHSAAYTVACGGCFEDRTLVALARRPGAAIDGQPAVLRANEVLASAWRMVELQPYGLTVGARSFVLVSGAPGNGKTTWALTAADSVPGPCVVVSAELGHGPALAALLGRCGVKRSDVLISDGALSVDGLVELGRTHKARAVVVDSLQEAFLNGRELRHVIGLLPDLSVLVATAQLNRAGSPAGVRAIEHEADVHVTCEAMRWGLLKNRFGAIEMGGPVLRQRSASTTENTEVSHAQ